MKVSKKFTKLLALMALALVFLSACGSTTDPITSESTGIWDTLIIYPFSQIILWFSDLFNSYGMGIIIFTVIIRIILIPLMNYQYKGQNKMQAMQPELQELQKRYSSRDQDTQEKLMVEQKKVYEKHNYKMWTSFIPLIVQMPLIIGLYQAISRTQELQSGSFLWFHLGQPDPYFILPVLAGVFTFLTTYLTSIGQKTAQPGGKMMLVTMPVMITVIAINLPSALSLYWVISNLFGVIQILALNNPFKKRREEEAIEEKQREFEKRVKRVKNPKKRWK